MTLHPRRILGTLLAASALAVPAATQAIPATATSAPQAHAACSYATIGGARRCIAAGEFCARAHQRDYKRYGYSCSKRDRNGRYHLVHPLTVRARALLVVVMLLGAAVAVTAQGAAATRARPNRACGHITGPTGAELPVVLRGGQISCLTARKAAATFLPAHGRGKQLFLVRSVFA